jgi:2-oxoglutarate dehydrogenase E1 component
VGQTNTELTRFIEEAFGSNATYVEGLLERYKRDPKLVDESWQDYFSELLNGGAPSVDGGARALAPSAETRAVARMPEPAEKSAGTAKKSAATPLPPDTEPRPITGAARKIVENMEQSLSVPTATSSRNVPVKVLEENRRILNEHLASQGRGKASFTHIIAWGLVQALKVYPNLNFGYGDVGGTPSRLEHADVNLGIAIDIEKKDGSRNLLVPNIKGADKMNFAQFFDAYNDRVKRAREGKLEIPDFQGTTVTLTNPGTIGTVASNPRLMAGQSAIIATGAIEYPAEYQAMTAAALSQLGISKTVTVTSTYDHRVIQGAESGLFLAKIHEFLVGKHGLLRHHFSTLRSTCRRCVGHRITILLLLGGDRTHEQAEKQANVLQLINAYRIRAICLPTSIR